MVYTHNNIDKLTQFYVAQRAAYGKKEKFFMRNTIRGKCSHKISISKGL